MNRTDLAHEIASESGLTLEESIIKGIEITRVVINEQASLKTGKPAGTYITLSCFETNRDKETETAVLSHIIVKMLSDIHKKSSYSILVTGLGNDNITPDSLGVRTVEKVLATAHFTGQQEFSELNLRPVYVIEPGVMAQTGLESAEQLKFIADGIKPDFLIVIDSLACNERQRLAQTIQITDTGISPGSGVKNERKEFSKGVFGVPVIAIGVPTVIDLSFESNADKGSFMLVPRDIDLIITHFASVISGALNRALNPSLDESEIETLLK
ncbi:MAG: GPR endopeptidase [Oscillospiraceae bacterium]|nr:GPR endopeptidase [Oscillospiraceae bacterium]